MRNYPNTRHSSFHTTFNVLENLRIAAAARVVSERAFRDAEAAAVEFILAHRLYRSDRTGEVISERFTHLTYPWHWHYTVLRGLDYMRLTARHLRPATRGPVDLLKETAEAERALAAPEAHSRHAPRRDGEARAGESLEHPAGTSCSASARRSPCTPTQSVRRRNPGSSRARPALARARAGGARCA